jgi:hypothetical protein
MKVHFTYPLSNSEKWQGQLEVSATVDGQDAEITKVIHEDHNGKKSDLTYVVEQYTPTLYDSLCEMAVNDARNVGEEDYTMEMQNY